MPPLFLKLLQHPVPALRAFCCFFLGALRKGSHFFMYHTQPVLGTNVVWALLHHCNSFNSRLYSDISQWILSQGLVSRPFCLPRRFRPCSQLFFRIHFYPGQPGCSEAFWSTPDSVETHWLGALFFLVLHGPSP
jgi:hypothetical protein